jgi:hypothetical protein
MSTMHERWVRDALNYEPPRQPRTFEQAVTLPPRPKFSERSLAEAERVARNCRAVDGRRLMPNGGDLDYIANIIERLVAEVRRLQS